MNRFFPTALAMAMGCAPRYGHLGPIRPSELWTPRPVRYARVEGDAIAYVDSGGEGPAVVLVHGLSSWMGFWEHQFEALARTHRVLALDLPGYGASDRPDAPYTPGWFAARIADWMTAIGLGSAAIVGHSMGGQIALELALGRPDRVSALVLSAPSGIEQFRPAHALWMERYWTERRALDTSEEELRFAFTELVFGRVDASVERLIRERVQMRGTPELAGTSVAVSRSVGGMLRNPVSSRLGQIRQPTLVVFGDDDRMIPNPILTGGRPRQIAELARTSIPGASVVMVPKGGHTVHHDAPDVFNDAVEQFLARAGAR